MKFYFSGLKELLKKIISGQITSVLLYGPNSGLIDLTIKQIVKEHNLIIANHQFKDLTPTRLELIACSKNFFGNKELIKISNSPATISKELKEVVLKNNLHNFICFIGGSSMPASGMRKFFEDSPNLASVACYYEDEQTISKLTLQLCSSVGKIINEEALFYLKSHLKGDRQIIKNELTKLIDYTHDKKTITKEDVIKVLSSDLLANGDDMCVYFSKKEASAFLNEVKNLQEQNVNEILIIRALIRYYLNVYIVCTKIENGENIDLAIKTLYPPIFFKYIPDFKQVIRKMRAKDAVKILSILQSAEIDYKENSKSFDFFTQLYCPAHCQ